MTAADEFEAHRRHLTGVAYRMLGSLAEAEDAVQEAWLRYQGADHAAIRDVRGWLTTVTGRICLDVLRSARVRREAYVGPWLPEPLVERLADPTTMDPADRVARDTDVSVALLAMLERLSPEQRVAFVLHDVFDVPFDEIGRAIGVSTDAARQHASRGRRAVRDGAPRHTASLAEQREVVGAFLAACQRGDLTGLLAVLAPEVAFTGDGGGLAPAVLHPVAGLEPVARFVLGLIRRAGTLGSPLLAEPVLVNGDLGILFHQRDSVGGQQLTTVMCFAVADERITAVYNQLNPTKLTRTPVPDPARSAWPPGTR
jgi:RNA polymerase sigma-70 factor (ECF subfamily)